MQEAAAGMKEPGDDGDTEREEEEEERALRFGAKVQSTREREREVNKIAAGYAAEPRTATGDEGGGSEGGRKIIEAPTERGGR